MTSQLVLGRRDPPMDEWPGKRATLERIALASGDDEDWFTFEERLRCWEEVEDNFELNRERRGRNLKQGFNFSQILVPGKMGAFKSVSVTDEAVRLYERGHALFHNGYQLPGWELSDLEIFDIVDVIPKYSVVVLDEAHTALETSMGRSVALRMFQFLSTGLRKKKCRMFLPSANDRMIYPPVREAYSEVRRPRAVKVNVNRPRRRWEKKGGTRPAIRAENFVYAYDVWRDYPYQRGDILTGQAIEGRQRQQVRNGGLGPPDDTIIVSGERVRKAMLMNDSFKPVRPAVAMLTSREDIKDRARARAEGRAPGSLGGDEANVATAIASVLYDFEERQARRRQNDEPEERYIKAPVIAGAAGISHQKLAQIVSTQLGLSTERGKGYDAAQLAAALRARYNFGAGE